MKSILTFLLFMAFGKLFAQEDSLEPHPVGSAESHVVDSAFYYNVDINAAFFGGSQAWKRYLAANIRHPSSEIRNNVVVQVLVSKEGEVDSTKVISGPPKLHEEAIRLVRKPIWTPGILNGRKVNSWATVTIPF